MKRFNSYNVVLNYEVKDGVLSYSGTWTSLKTWISHSFKKDSVCFIKDKRNYNKKKALVIKITEDFVTLRVIGNKVTNKVSIENFISDNYTAQTLIRLEFNGKGLYSASKELPLEIKTMLEQHKEESRNGERHNQPVPKCSNILEMIEFWKFAFNSYEQLFNWFTLSEISLMMKHNVKIVNLQEFVDFEKTLYSSEQVAYTTNTESNLYKIFDNSY
jgi:hypothetical protein